MERDEHIQAVNKWLDDNVLVCETPTAVDISDFQLRPDSFSGSFQVALDGVKLSDRFSFGLGGNGKPDLFFPMFHSPLGAPASYAAVELTSETALAIKRLLESALPKMKALGYNRATGEMVFRTTHSDSARIVDKAAYEECMKQISQKEFSARCFVAGH